MIASDDGHGGRAEAGSVAGREEEEEEEENCCEMIFSS